jgi:peptide/nickel transport system ATP-binding protein
MHPLLEIRNLGIDFVTENGTAEAVRDITFTVNRGEIVGIAGESGSGKSVTSLSVPRLLNSPPARYVSGEILFSPDGITLVDMLTIDKTRLRGIRGGGIGVIFQEPMTSLNPVFTCGDQVMESVLLHNDMNKQQAKAKTLSLFAQVKLPGPAGIFERYPHQLSGGQKQRVMIAMAMSGNPSLLICDEPTTALDVTVQKNILQLILELQAETGMGVIFITHDLGVIAGIAGRVIIMNKGRIVEQGPVDQVFQSPEQLYTKALLACRPSLYEKGTRLPVVGDFTANGAMKLVTMPGAIQPAADETLIDVDKLHVWFPSKRSFTGKVLEYNKAVNGVSFSIKKGETLGLVGESGCGKTTIGRALLKLVNPHSGTISFQGEDILRIQGSALNNFRTRAQIIFQDPYSSLNPSVTIGMAIAEPLIVHRPGARLRQIKEEVIGLLEKVNLKGDHFYRYPHEFSGGQRQRIVIARALALNPEFIVCDESVSALDVSVQAQVLNLLNDLKSEFGFTSLFISHDLSVIRYISDRIIVMRNGLIEEAGNAGEIYNHPRSAYTRKLLDSIPGLHSN